MKSSWMLLPISQVKRILTTIVVFGLLPFCFATDCHQRHRRGSRYLIPKGYIGWIKVNYKVEGAQALPIEDNLYLFKVPFDGRINAPSDIEYGSSHEEYYYYSDSRREELHGTGWGHGGMLWGQFNGRAGGSKKESLETYQYFFVGSEEQFRKCGSEKENDGHPKVGPLNEAVLTKCLIGIS
jgi:hypothetical protein